MGADAAVTATFTDPSADLGKGRVQQAAAEHGQAGEGAVATITEQLNATRKEVL